MREKKEIYICDRSETTYVDVGGPGILVKHIGEAKACSVWHEKSKLPGNLLEACARTSITFAPCLDARRNSLAV